MKTVIINWTRFMSKQSQRHWYLFVLLSFYTTGSSSTRTEPNEIYRSFRTRTFELLSIYKNRYCISNTKYETELELLLFYVNNSGVGKVNGAQVQRDRVARTTALIINRWLLKLTTVANNNCPLGGRRVSYSVCTSFRCTSSSPAASVGPCTPCRPVCWCRTTRTAIFCTSARPSRTTPYTGKRKNSGATLCILCLFSRVLGLFVFFFFLENRILKTFITCNYFKP